MSQEGYEGLSAYVSCQTDFHQDRYGRRGRKEPHISIFDCNNISQLITWLICREKLFKYLRRISPHSSHTCMQITGDLNTDRKRVTLRLSISGARGADELSRVCVVSVHALGSNMLVSSAPHNLQGLILGLWTSVIECELPDFCVICVRAESIWNIILNLSSSNVAACRLRVW